MEKLPATVTKSRMWQTTIAQQPKDQSKSERERLRSAFIAFRERAAHLAKEVRKDLPMLTVHDSTHMDALGEIASIVTGEEIVFTPTEAFVLGGAFLLHDLAMSVAAIDGGMKAIRKDPRWSDLIFAEYRSAFGRDPTKAEQ